MIFKLSLFSLIQVAVIVTCPLVKVFQLTLSLEPFPSNICPIFYNYNQFLIDKSGPTIPVFLYNPILFGKMSLWGSKVVCKMPFHAVETFPLLFWDLIPDWHEFYIYQYGFLLELQEKCHQTALWEKTKGQKFDPTAVFWFGADGMVGNRVCQMCWWSFLHTFSWWMIFWRSFLPAVSGCKVTDSFYISSFGFNRNAQYSGPGVLKDWNSEDLHFSVLQL